ncbi:MAG: hypothetical protein LRY74_07580, partial [Shewanella xiamenensis]|nr:hypothetical protein [Shewanella xiamenensis]
MDGIWYGPQRPEPDNAYTKHPTPYYHNRFAVKMRHDLEKYFRLCAGKQFTLLRRVKDGGRCTTCTDVITGQILLDNCPECGGSGYSLGYSVIGKYWSIPEIGPEERITGEFGNTESSGAARDTFVIVGAPLLRETDLVALTATG